MAFKHIEEENAFIDAIRVDPNEVACALEFLTRLRDY